MSNRLAPSGARLEQPQHEDEKDDPGNRPHHGPGALGPASRDDGSAGQRGDGEQPVDDVERVGRGSISQRHDDPRKRGYRDGQARPDDPTKEERRWRPSSDDKDSREARDHDDQHEHKLGGEAVDLRQRSGLAATDAARGSRGSPGRRAIARARPAEIPGRTVGEARGHDRQTRHCHQVGALGQVALPDAIEDVRDLWLDDPVVDAGAVASRGDDALGAKDRQLLADDRLARIQLVLQVGDIALADFEQLEDPETKGVAEHANDPGCSLQHQRVDPLFDGGRWFHVGQA